MRTLKGQGASPGVVVGPVYLFAPPSVTISEEEVPPERRGDEERAFLAGRERAARALVELRERVRVERGDDLAGVFEGHEAILTDEELGARIVAAIRAGRSASAAVRDAIERERDEFLALEDEYLRRRADDLVDIGRRLTLGIAGLDAAGLESVPKGAVIVARDLTPSDTAQIDPTRVAGFVIARGGFTGHVAILARAMELPAVIGCGEALRVMLPPGAEIALDGSTGEVVINPDSMTRAAFIARSEAWKRERAETRETAPLCATTRDGTKVFLAANIASPADAEAARAWNPDGVGLFRSEFLFMGRRDLPGEEEQRAAYARVASLFPGAPVIIRTLDAGGDKPVATVGYPSEENPFLGWRGARLALYPNSQATGGIDTRAMLITQIRAVLRAATAGDVRIMFPMIANKEETAALVALVEEARESLRRDGLRFGPVGVGVMIETPGAAMMTDKIASLVDFVSIGSNDLTQYALAADRGNEVIADCYQPFHPGVWRMIAEAIRGARAAGKEVGMCGELAGMEDATLPLLGLGLTEFSMNAPSLPRVKRVIRAATITEARETAARVLDAGTAEEARRIAVEATRDLAARARPLSVGGGPFYEK